MRFKLTYAYEVPSAANIKSFKDAGFTVFEGEDSVHIEMFSLDDLLRLIRHCDLAVVVSDDPDEICIYSDYLE